MKNLIIATAVVLLFGSTAYGGWYVGPPAGYYAYYPAPLVAPAPYVAYSPVVTYSPAWAGPVVAPAPVWIGRPVVVGPAGRVYVPGRPVRNVIRAVVP
jgi:hypothetical protein